MAVKTAPAKKTAPKKAVKKTATTARKAPAVAKKATPRASGVDYRTARAQRQAALTAERRRTYEQAYHDAGRAMDLAELVYTARTDAGLTQTQLAAAMGTSQSAVAAWENGARTPGIDALERLAAACGKRLRITITAA
ncbi:MAG: XRE family transcriptional regulator [Mycobacterium sp.]|nr:MAG: XRE family transcriptional regulator [Mycobacterium sp.]